MEIKKPRLQCRRPYVDGYTVPENALRYFPGDQRGCGVHTHRDQHHSCADSEQRDRPPPHGAMFSKDRRVRPSVPRTGRPFSLCIMIAPQGDTRCSSSGVALPHPCGSTSTQLSRGFPGPPRTTTVLLDIPNALDSIGEMSPILEEFRRMKPRFALYFLSLLMSYLHGLLFCC